MKYSPKNPIVISAFTLAVALAGHAQDKDSKSCCDPTVAVSECGSGCAHGESQAGAAFLQPVLNVPTGLPKDFSLTIPFSGESLTLEFEKNHIFGENSKYLVDDGTGELEAVDLGEDRSYLGKVVGRPELTVSAVLTGKGILAYIIRPGQESIIIEPLEGQGELHKISVGEADSQSLCQHTGSEGIVLQPEGESAEMAASTGPITTMFLPMVAANASALKSTATLPPKRVMDVLEYEIGVEIGSRSFFSKSAYNGNLEKAQASAQSIIGNLDARYLRAAGIKHRLGTVIIRTKVETDPLRDKVTATGGGRGSRGSLAAFRDYWNSNPKKVGKTHDLAVYHVKSAPSGLAYVNSVGSRNRYATSGGNGATSWANGTLAHEFGHSWNLRHTNDSGFFYEDKPRNSRGSHSAGGKSYYVSIMHGGGNHNIGRLATEEANMVYKIRERKRAYGDVVKNPGAIPPFGHRDIAFSKDGKPVKIDVIDNDYDANNDVLDVQLLDTVSSKGGTIALSKGTGPGRRNEVIYTAPTGFVGRDFFHYTVIDSTGRKDWGAVYVTSTGPHVVDTSKTVYNYDFGPLNSPVESKWTAITPETKGDISWEMSRSTELSSVDRGGKRGVNNINRDLVFSSGKVTLNHKVANGLWALSLNMGDRTTAHEKMKVLAEGVEIGSDVKSARGKFPYVTGKVAVTDGELNLEFSDEGGKDPNWVLTRLTMERVGDVPTKVDTSKKSYRYDLGPSGSLVEKGFATISPKTTGDIYWTGDPVQARDRKSKSDVGLSHRDFIHAKGVATLNHKLANGVWMVAVNMGDPTNVHDQMGVRAEGRLISDKITSPAGQFSFVNEKGASKTPVYFKVEVKDGELNLEFFDAGGTDSNWVVTRLALKKR